MPDWVDQIIALFVGGGVIATVAVKLLPNLIIERLKPGTSEEIKRRENFVNAKRDVYYEGIRLVARSFASQTWAGPGAELAVPAHREIEDYVTKESEVNECLAKLALYTDNANILEQFIKCISGGQYTDLSVLADLMRQDLGHGPSVLTGQGIYFWGGQFSDEQLELRARTDQNVSRS